MTNHMAKVDDYTHDDPGWFRDEFRQRDRLIADSGTSRTRSTNTNGRTGSRRSEPVMPCRRGSRQ